MLTTRRALFVFVACCLTFTLKFACADRPDEPPGDAKVRRCQSLLGAAENERRAVPMLADGTIVIAHHVEGEFHVIYVYPANKEYLLNLAQTRAGVVLTDRQIERRTLTDDEYRRLTAAPREGDIEIGFYVGPRINRAYYGDNRLKPGDVIERGAAHYVVIDSAPAEQWDLDEGAANAELYRALAFARPPTIGAESKVVEELVVGGFDAGDPALLVRWLGVAEVSLRLDITPGRPTDYRGRIRALTTHPPEPERVMTLTTRTFFPNRRR